MRRSRIVNLKERKGKARRRFASPAATLPTASDVREALGVLNTPTWGELARHLRIRQGAGAHRLRRLLHGLMHLGEVAQTRAGAYMLTKAATEVREVVRRGGALALQGLPDELPADLPVRVGDRVEVQRAATGVKVLRVAEPSPAPVVGCVQEDWRKRRFVESLDPAIKGRIRIEGEDVPAKPGDIVAVRLLWEDRKRAKAHFAAGEGADAAATPAARRSPGGRREAPPSREGKSGGRRRGGNPLGRFTGRIDSVLESRNEADRAATALLASHRVPVSWPADVPLEAPQEVSRKDAAGREDLTALHFVTIDGADARDFDDAVHAERRARGGWRLRVAIADVAHYVAPGTPLDVEARRRGNSVYLPDRVVPMLPEALSNGICSLQPHRRRLAVVCDMQVSPAGRVSRFSFYGAVVESHARLEYEAVARSSAALGPAARGAAPHETSLAALFEAYRALRERREERGALDFDAREQHLELADGRIASLRPRQRNDAHQLVEEAMIAANVCAARRVADLGAIYRVHEPPTGEKREQLAAALAFGGVRLKAGELSPKALRAAMVDAVERSTLPRWLLEALVLRSMTQARYQPCNRGHFGLALPRYAHFTSPIRRYADLVVHRIIKSGFSRARGRPAAPPQNWLEETGSHISMTERRADDVSRAVADWLKCDFIASRVGERFRGTVAGVQEFGLFVELEETGVQGLIHVSRLGRDYYRFVPESLSLVAERSGSRFSLGDALIVELEEVAVETRRVDLALVRRASPRPASAKGAAPGTRASRARKASQPRKAKNLSAKDGR